MPIEEKERGEWGRERGGAGGGRNRGRGGEWERSFPFSSLLTARGSTYIH